MPISPPSSHSTLCSFRIGYFFIARSFPFSSAIYSTLHCSTSMANSSQSFFLSALVCVSLFLSFCSCMSLFLSFFLSLFLHFSVSLYGSHFSFTIYFGFFLCLCVTVIIIIIDLLPNILVGPTWDTFCSENWCMTDATTKNNCLSHCSSHIQL